VAFARAAGLIELWARASHNLGVLAFRTGRYEEASASLGEALRLSAEAQHTELQLVSTYTLAHVALETEDFRRSADIFELSMELAERIGQSEIQAGSLAGLALSHLAKGDVETAVRLNARLGALVASQTTWFQNREFVEAVAIHLALQRGDESAAERFNSTLALMGEQDAYGAAWLIAEFGEALLGVAPELVREAVDRYGNRPEVLDNPRIRQRFGVLIVDSAKMVDRH
jgi:tetratricopeptide (TPR) repeat protein